MSGLNEQEIEARWDHFTGSTTATFLGRNHYASPSHGWEANRDRVVFEENDLTFGGNALEGGIASIVERELGMETYKPETLYHPEYPEAFLVHLDRVSDAEQLGVQIKNHQPFMFKAAYNGAPVRGGWHNTLVPEALLIQCQVEMMVAHAAWGGEWGKQWVLASFFGGPKPRLYWIHRDTTLQAAILSAGLTLWRKHLDPNGPCEPMDDKHWIGPAKGKRPAPKLTTEELAAAPVPF